jgi:hypothetical protein
MPEPPDRKKWIALAPVLRCAAMALLVCGCVTWSAVAEEQPELPARVAALIERLDSDQFHQRTRAASELKELISSSASAEVVALAIKQSLARPELSFEVRKQLESWLPLLPQVKADPPADQPDEDLAALVDQLEDDSFAVRIAARRRLELLASEAPSAGVLAMLLRDRLAAPKLSTDSHQRLLGLWEKARGTWLVSDPATWKLPQPNDTEIKQALAHLAKPAASDRAELSAEQQAARRQLLDMLAFDDAVPRIVKAIEAALAADGLDQSAQARLDSVLELTQPAMVAEIWQNRENILVQHLYVDVPQQVAGAPRASHFSRIDDETAQCESGSNLEPDEYPVGVAIPHSTGKDWICHLINLPNPRRRQAYDYALLVDERVRLAELTERTIRRLTAKRLPMSDQLLNALVQNKLDATALSEQVGSYLMTIEDRAVEEGGDTALGAGATHHQRVCFVLALLGTRHAGPGLLRVIEAKRCRSASLETTPYQWPQIAALAIAARDPWPDAELWLASQIGNAEPLAIIPPGDDEQNGPEQDPAEAALPQLGAGAAALLLKQHELAPSSFGLVPVRAKTLENLDCPCYRFASPDDHKRVIAWWQDTQQQRHRRQTP